MTNRRVSFLTISHLAPSYLSLFIILNLSDHSCYSTLKVISLDPATRSKDCRHRCIRSIVASDVPADLYSRSSSSTFASWSDQTLLTTIRSLSFIIQGVVALVTAIPIEELHLGDKGGPVGGGLHKQLVQRDEESEDTPIEA